MPFFSEMTRGPQGLPSPGARGGGPSVFHLRPGIVHPQSTQPTSFRTATETTHGSPNLAPRARPYPALGQRKGPSPAIPLTPRRNRCTARKDTPRLRLSSVAQPMASGDQTIELHSKKSSDPPPYPRGTLENERLCFGG